MKSMYYKTINVLLLAIMIASSNLNAVEPKTSFSTSDNSAIIYVAGAAVTAAALYALYRYAFSPVPPQKTNEIEQKVAKVERMPTPSDETKALIRQAFDKIKPLEQKPDFFGYRADLALAKIDSAQDIVSQANQAIVVRSANTETNNILLLNTNELFTTLKDLLKYTPGKDVATIKQRKDAIKNAALKLLEIYTEYLQK